MQRPHIKHCRNCGAATQMRVPEDGDTRERAVCPACGTIHYVNPLVVVGTLPVFEGRVLLCRRAIEPRHGMWTLPAGFMELGETLAEGAARETAEEAGAQIELGPCLTLISVPGAGQVHAFFLARMLSADLHPGPETLQARLFAEADIPWDELAFPTVRETLRRFFADRARGADHATHTFDIA